jgi:hypothetical protein
MHRAPAVEVVVVADRAARVALAAIGAAAAASLAAWLAAWLAALGSAPAALAGGLALAVGLAAGSAAGLAGAAPGLRWRPAAAHLRWDGQGWSLLPAGTATPVAGRAAGAVDLDGWVLLRLDAAASRRWLPLSRAAHRAAWHALRCALQARSVDADPLASAQV